jgi:hypothetical protein
MSQVSSPILPLTEARSQLFRLAEDVWSGAVDRVRLTHRSQPDDLLLMRASAVAQLERELAELRSRIAPEVRPLAGLGTLHVTDNELLAFLSASRSEYAAAADSRQSVLAAELKYPVEKKRSSRVAEQSSVVSSQPRHRAKSPKGGK